jgi:hypothetical protein
MIRLSPGIGLLFLTALAGCAGAEIAAPLGGRNVTIDLRTLLSPPAGSTQTDCISTIAEAELRVGPQGTPRRLPVSAAAGASSVTFDGIEVQQGTVPFSVSILSNNGTQLYGKDTTVRVDAGTFEVAMTVEKRAPVLQVCPAHMILDRAGSFRQTLEVINRGTGGLAYEVRSPECPAGPCIAVDPATGTLAGGGALTLVDSLIQILPASSLELMVQSPGGSLPVAVALGPVPDIVVKAFAITDTLRLNRDSARFELPVSLTLRNDGNTPADTFKVAAEYTGKVGTFVTPFQVNGATFFYPFTTTPLGPGETVTLVGSVFLPFFSGGQVVQLRMEADSCSGEEDAAVTCRIDEFSEINNRSLDIPVELPQVIHATVKGSHLWIQSPSS